MTFNFFGKKVKKAKVDTLQAMQKSIDVQLKTFTNHLRQIDSEYQSLHEDNLKIMELLQEKKG